MLYHCFKKKKKYFFFKKYCTRKGFCFPKALANIFLYFKMHLCLIPCVFCFFFASNRSLHELLTYWFFLSTSIMAHMVTMYIDVPQQNLVSHCISKSLFCKQNFFIDLGNMEERKLPAWNNPQDQISQVARRECC